MKIKQNALVFLCALQSASVFGWNALGHQLIAAIAYEKMTPHAKQVFNAYNHALDKVYKPQSFINAAVWLDTLRYRDVNWFDAMHYIDIPVSSDNQQLPLQTVNAVWAIDKSTRLLSNPHANAFDKGIALRVLLHVVGDVHQPLHAATRISATHPKGDKGGNLVLLKHNPIARNLHSYWDKGAGLLTGKKQNSALQIQKMAIKLAEQYPCAVSIDLKPKRWAYESNQLAALYVYRPLTEKAGLNSDYQKAAQSIAAKQIALAGCRLGALLNQIDTNLAKKSAT